MPSPLTLDFRAGFWRLADPKISLASFAGMALAGLFAAADSGFQITWFLLTVVGIFCIEVGKNASGELVDYDSGTDLAVSEADRSPFSGGKRVLVDGLLTRAQTRTIAGVFFALGIACGLVIAVWREPAVLGAGLVGVALAWFYHGPPLRLSYRGLGEFAVALGYGPLVVNGTYLVQVGALNPLLLHLSGVLGLLVMSFLWINQFPDHRADRASGKRNLVVRLGLRRAAVAYVVVVIAAYLWLLLAGLADPGWRGALPGLAGAIPGLLSCWRLLNSAGHTAATVPAQTGSLLSFLLMALGSGLGYGLLGTGVSAM
jgi:1,4-dihydroxy-2-naphthoate octaprenyltransferase